MKAFVYHIQLNVSDPKISFKFYKDLLAYFEYKITYEDKEVIGLSNGTCDFWIQTVEKKYLKDKFHRKNTGINHIAFRVDKKEYVDRFYKEFILPRKMSTLYKTPREFPEYEKGYYAIYFEDPDRIKLEITYLPNA